MTTPDPKLLLSLHFVGNWNPAAKINGCRKMDGWMDGEGEEGFIFLFYISPGKLFFIVAKLRQKKI